MQRHVIVASNRQMGLQIELDDAQRGFAGLDP